MKKTEDKVHVYEGEFITLVVSSTGEVGHLAYDTRHNFIGQVRDTYKVKCDVVDTRKVVKV